MVDSRQEEPLQTGDDFIFVCYSHADEAVVLSQVDWLRREGYVVWYDANIRGGAEWNDELARHIQDCRWFVYFVSPRSVQSVHCRAELNYAQQTGRQIIAIEIEPTEVPAGLQLMLNARQTVFLHKHSQEEFETRLTAALEHEAESVPSATGRLQASVAAAPKKRNWLAAAAIAVLAVGALAFTLYRSPEPPQIDFEERDWVVVGNLQNRTDDPLIGEALETSLRFALKQSKYAGVLPEATLREAKRRMQLDPDKPLDQELAIELAKRENARASVLGSIAQLGNSYRISVEIIDTATGASTWAGESTVTDIDDLLPAIDDVSRKVREELGESLSSIMVTSEPLSKVTTPDLEALRAYSLGEKAVARGEWETGQDLLERAIARDPEFAMAHGKMAAVYIAWALQPERAFEHYEIALRNKDRLTPREAIYIEASSAWQKTPSEMRGAWEAMTLMFPNEAVGFNNYGEVVRRYFLDFEAAEAAYRSSSELRDPWVYLAFNNLGQALLALGRSEEALSAFQTSFAMSGNPVMYSMADAYTVLGRHDDALAFIAGADETQSPNLIRSAQLKHLATLADLGDFEGALEIAANMLDLAESPDQFSRIYAARIALLEARQDAARLRQALDDGIRYELAQLEQDASADVRMTLVHGMILSRIALRNGMADLAEDAIAKAREGIPDNGFPVDQAWLELLEAELLLQAGDAEGALDRVTESIRSAELFQAHESRARIHAELGNADERMTALNWLQDHRGRAFAESIDWFYGQLFNVIDWSRAVEYTG